MLKCQENLSNYLRKLGELLQGTEFSQDATLLDKVLRTELLLPVIGAFSAGKSSLLNTLIGREVLPVGIAPETELATELRYAPEPYLLAIRHDGEEERLPVESLGNINKRASEYSHLRLYLDSGALKDIAPLVLVDMPGYGSSLESHNKALAFYLPRGVHFIVVTSVEDGNITQSMIRRLDEVKTYNSDFTFLLSKCNLRAPEQVAEVAAYVDEQLQMYFGPGHQVIPAGNQGAYPLAEALKSIDPEKLFTNLFLDTLKDQNIDLLSQINLAVSVLKRDEGESEKALRGLEQALNRLLDQKTDAESEVRNRYSGRLLDRCLKGVENDLNNALGELSALAANRNNPNGLNNAISEIIRSSLGLNIKQEVDAISTSMIDDLAASLSTASQSMAVLGPDRNWAGDLTEKVTLSLGKTTELLTDWSDRLGGREDKGRMGDHLYKGLSTVLAVTTTVINPILELVIIFLPEILQFFAGGNAQDRTRERLQGEVFPGIKAELRRSLPQILNEQLSLMLKKVNEAFEQQIAQQRDIIAAYKKENAEREAQAGECVQTLEALSSAVKALANQHLYV